jgi:hypothetical protein
MGGYLGGALQGLGSAATGIGQHVGQTTGLTNLAQGLQSLFGGQPTEAGRLAAQGQPPVPAGVELVGPSETFAPTQQLMQGPGFGSGFLEGFTNTLKRYGEPSAGTSFGQGFGQLARFIDERRSAGGDGGLGQIVELAALADPMWKRKQPIVSPVIKPEPTLVGNIVSGYTGGILRGTGA